MAASTSRILIETVVRKTIKDISDSPQRSIRNLVDLALHFSSGRFQRDFFEAARQMLQNEHSPYYDLIQDAVEHVDSERLLQFGMNLGYNGCTMGARTIRTTEAAGGFNIPWSITLRIDSEILQANASRYHELIREGNELGIYAWQLFGIGQPQALLDLAGQHPDNAFFLFCAAEDITDEFLEAAALHRNLMLAVPLGKNAALACTRMRLRKLLYSVYYPYTETDVAAILEGRPFAASEALHPIFTVLIPSPDCPQKARQQVYSYVLQARDQQLYSTIAWEAEADSNLVDSIISEDACSVFFDECGNLYLPDNRCAPLQPNLFFQQLRDILRCAFPKTQKEEPI